MAATFAKTSPMPAHILVVEDDPEIQELLGLNLEQAGQRADHESSPGSGGASCGLHRRGSLTVTQASSRFSYAAW